MVDVYIPPLRTKSGCRFGYYIQKTEEEIAAEIAREKEKALKERLYVIPVKLTSEQMRQRRKEKYSSPEYLAFRRMMYHRRRQDPEYLKRAREKEKAYREKKKAEKARLVQDGMEGC